MAERPENYAPEVEKVNRRLFLLGVFGIILFFFTIGCYVVYFNGGLEPDTGTWGEFGDFVGGTINPVLGFLTFIGVLWTISLTYTELHNQQQQQTKDDLYRLISVLHEELKETLSDELLTGRIIPVYPVSPEKATIEEILKFDLCSNEFAELVEKQQHIFEKIERMLSQLIFYLHKYDQLARNDYVSAFYKTYYEHVVSGLCDRNAISKSLKSFFASNLTE